MTVSAPVNANEASSFGESFVGFFCAMEYELEDSWIFTCLIEEGDAPRFIVSVPKVNCSVNKVEYCNLILCICSATYFYRILSRNRSMPNYCLGRVCLEVAVAIGRELLRPLSPPIDGATITQKKKKTKTKSFHEQPERVRKECVNLKCKICKVKQVSLGS